MNLVPLEDHGLKSEFNLSARIQNITFIPNPICVSISVNLNINRTFNLAHDKYTSLSDLNEREGGKSSTLQERAQHKTR